MSDPAEPFREALDDKVVDGDCPFCHENTWATALGLVRVILAPGDIDPGGNGSTVHLRGFDAFTIACTTCGFLRMHHADTLMGD